MDADQNDALRESNERLNRALQAASGPGLPARGDADLARRVADGAWARARKLKSGPGRRLRLLRPLFLAAAAAALLAAVVLRPFGGAEMALAVEGDPVLVWKGDDWKEQSQVAAGRYVFVPHEGRRVLRFVDGSEIEPSPGAVFVAMHTNSTTTALPYELKILRGTVQYAGTALSMSAAEIDLAPDPDAYSRPVRVSVTSSAGARTPVELPRLLAFEWSGDPRVAVTAGSFTLRARRTGQLLSLAPAECATFVRLAGDPSTGRLSRVRAFSAGALEEVVRGKLPVDLSIDTLGGIMVVLGDADPDPFDVLTAIEIPSQDRDSAIRQLNTATFLRQHLTRRLANGGMTVRIHVETDFTPQPGSEYVMESGGNRFAVYVRSDGTCRLDENGTVTEFRRLAELRAKAPHVAAAFGDLLPR